MAKIESGSSPQAVLQGAQHILFVEGTIGGLDVTVLSELLSPKLRVEPLGPSFSIRSAASALHEFHPHYWFVIDRDDWDDATVESSWRDFPNPNADNLLIWRRKELENYFLEPAWFCLSTYVKKTATEAKIQTWLTREATKTLWLVAANRVLIRCRNAIKRSAGDLLKASDVEGCNREQVLDKLLASDIVLELRKATTVQLKQTLLRETFFDECKTLSGGRFPLAWGIGKWRDLMPAKTLFRSLVNQWAAVPDLAAERKPRLMGRAAERALAVNLLRNHPAAMPDDLRELKAILDRAIR